MSKPKLPNTKRLSTRKASKPKARKSKSLAEVNAWLSTNHEALVGKARRNCVRLTGKPTFGQTTRRKSA
jgi:hypothetical protein